MDESEGNKDEEEGELELAACSDGTAPRLPSVQSLLYYCEGGGLGTTKGCHGVLSPVSPFDA